MIYAFEGIAGAGKSTLIGEFCRVTGLPEFEDRGRHGVLSGFSTPYDWMLRSAQHDLDLATLSRMIDFVTDRWILSSRVYGRQRNDSLPDDKTREILEISDAVVFVVCCDPEVARERLLRRDGRSKRTFGELIVDAAEMEEEARFTADVLGADRVRFVDGNAAPGLVARRVLGELDAWR